jgi:valyl-tRNA synthetase
MENIKDWCISRQLWWGHRIPCWYCDTCGEMIVAKDDPTMCPKCKSKVLRQDEDVLDTWFSSALWPFSTLGYPDKTEELEYFYPTSLLVTAYDIIFFWVARMIFSGIEHMGETPFPEVLIHGIVRDEKGRKMSKSLGNGIDPLILIDKFGADALRFSLTTGVAPGGDIRFSEDKMESSRNFMNKLWNASRYVLMNLEDKDIGPIDKNNLTDADKWILTKLQVTIEEVRKNLEKYEFGLSLAKLYDFIWSDYCDWFIELTKPMLYSQDEKAKENALSVLKYVLCDILKLMHPFVPFITEEIWEQLDISETIMTESYPKYDESLVDMEALNNFESIKEIIVKIRNIRAEMNVPPTKKCRLFIKTLDTDSIKKASLYIEKLAQVTEINFVNDKTAAGDKICQAVTQIAEIYIPLGELVDFEKEVARISKEIEKVNGEIKRSQGMLNNASFVAKAPPKLIENEKEKLASFTALLEKLHTQLKDYD